jgi:hypothetical protein
MFVLGFVHTARMEDCECESHLDDCKPVFNEGANHTTGMVSVTSEPQTFCLELPYPLEDSSTPSKYKTEVTTFGDLAYEMTEIVSGTEDCKPFGESQSCLIHGHTHFDECPTAVTDPAKSSIKDSCLLPVNCSGHTSSLTSHQHVEDIKPVCVIRLPVKLEPRTGADISQYRGNTLGLAQSKTEVTELIKTENDKSCLYQEYQNQSRLVTLIYCHACCTTQTANLNV